MEDDDRCGWCGGSGSTADCPEEDDATTTCPECHGWGKEPGLPPLRFGWSNGDYEVSEAAAEYLGRLGEEGDR